MSSGKKFKEIVIMLETSFQEIIKNKLDQEEARFMKIIVKSITKLDSS
jgi:transcriptional regulator of NAD metabolism